MYFVGITGASGTIFGIRLASELAKKDSRVTVCFSRPGELVAAHELNMDSFSLKKISELISPTHEIEVISSDDLSHTAASGSSPYETVFVCPCSMSTLAHIAYGTGSNLIHRAADVALKERKKLILVPRETPLSLVHLRAMTAAAEAGAVILPPIPAFYPQPETVNDIIDFVVGRILDAAGIENDLYRRWNSSR